MRTKNNNAKSGLTNVRRLFLSAFIFSFSLHGATSVTLYQTSFEAPAFTAGLPLRGQDNWEMFHDGEAISVSTTNAKTGPQCLRVEGALLEQSGPNFATAYCFSRALVAYDSNPPPIVEIRSSVRLDGPQTGTLGTPEQSILGANLMAVVLLPNGAGVELGGFIVSSGGKIWNHSLLPADDKKYSVPYTFGTYRDLALRVDFIARRMTWSVDGVELGSGPFPSTITADQLASGYLFLNGPVDPINTPELTYDMTNYVAYFDDYSLKSVAVEGAAILVDQPAGLRLTSGADTINFGGALPGTAAPLVFTVRNVGDADLTGVAVTLEGPHAADFAITAPPAGTVGAGGSTSFTITFTPVAPGTRTVSLRIASNDPDDNPFIIALTGIGLVPTQIAQQAYLKAANTGEGDGFGSPIALSGNTLVVVAGAEASSAIGVNGNQANNSAPGAGAAYVFVREGTNWVQQAYLKASNTGAGDAFGSSVAISGDTIVIGAIFEDSNATGVNGNQSNNSALNSGAAYVFVRNGTNWTQQAYLKASNAAGNPDPFFPGDLFGSSVAVSGNTIVVGASYEDSNATGVNGDQKNNSAAEAGAAYVFVREGTNWTQQAYLKASNTGAGDVFGYSLAISGETILVGAIGESSNATGTNGNQGNNAATNSGAAYVFVREGTNWIQQAYLKASNPDIWDSFGGFAAIQGDTAVIAAYGESSNATGVNGNQGNNNAANSGAAYVFVREGTNWTQQAYLKASNTQADDWFGSAVAVEDNMVIVGAYQESSNATGVNGNQNSNSAQWAGAAYLFAREGTNWTQQAYLKASNTGAEDFFGISVAMSGDTLVIGAYGESSNATGMNGNQNNNSATYSGAAYVFTRMGSLPPELRLTATRAGAFFHLTATGTTNTQWRLEFCETLTGTNAWQPLTNITLGASPTLIQQPLDSTNRFYRGTSLP